MMKSSTAIKHIAKVMVLLFVVLIMTSTVNADSLCENILREAYKRLDESCNTVARNQACYGNDAIQVRLNAPYENNIFTRVGDIAPLTAINELYTLPMDTTTGTWGVSLLKVQANLPDTAPGQNVVFLLYGNTHLINADDEGRMSAFYFTSGLGLPSCKAAPSDGITIRSPKGMKAQFSANGVLIEIGSTVILRASPHKEIRIHLVEGTAKITADNKSVVLLPGQTTSVPLGGIDGLQPIGSPSIPVGEQESIAHQTFMAAIGQSAAPTTVSPIQRGQPSATSVPVIVSATAVSTQIFMPTNTPKSSKPTYTPKPPKPTYTPKSSKPTYTPKAQKPTNTPKPPKPTDTPKPPKPTKVR